MMKTCKELHGTRLTPENRLCISQTPKKGNIILNLIPERPSRPLSPKPLSKSGDCKGNKSFRNKQNKNIFLSRKHPPNPKIQTLPRRGTTKVETLKQNNK